MPAAEPENRPSGWLGNRLRRAGGGVLRTRSDQSPLPELKQAIAKAKAAIDAEFPRKVESYTFLMLDGNRLIAHRDARTCVPYYTLHSTSADGLEVVCSEVLPTLPGRWRMFRNGAYDEFHA